jgi:hypothetical protein
MKASMVRRKCRQCGAAFERYKSECRKRPVRFCSSACARANQIGRPHPCRPRNLTPKPCANCGTQYMPRHSGSRFCSRACMNASMRGEKSANWKGGRHTDSHGYIWIRVPDHPRAKGYGYVKEHTIVMERELGRQLTSKESVHHVNGDRSDNRLANLQLRSKRHGNGVVLKCGDCGSSNIVHAHIGTSA